MNIKHPYTWKDNRLFVQVRVFKLVYGTCPVTCINWCIEEVVKIFDRRLAYVTPLFSSSEFWGPVQGSCTTAGALPFSPRANRSIWQSNMSNDSRPGLLYFMRLELDVLISSAANLGHWCDQGCHHWSYCVHRISSLLSPPIIRSNFAKTSKSTPLWSGSAPLDSEK